MLPYALCPSGAQEAHPPVDGLCSCKHLMQRTHDGHPVPHIALSCAYITGALLFIPYLCLELLNKAAAGMLLHAKAERGLERHRSNIMDVLLFIA